MFGPKKITQSVTFTTEDAADQALWEAIEKELSLTKYQTFSNLCKQALWQFLFVCESPTPTPTTPVSSVSTTAVSSGKLEEQMSQLRKQLSHLEDKVLTEEGDHFERLQRQLIQMTQQLAQLQVATTLKSSVPAPQPVVETPQSSSLPPVTAEFVAPEKVQPEKQIKVAAKQESDPVLQRLSSLVDDF